MKGFKYMVLAAIGFIYLLIATGCRDKQQAVQANSQMPSHSVKFTKAASSSGATMVVDKRSVLFFHPDSTQLESFKTTANAQIYESVTHDCFFQMRNARNVLKKYWPGLRIKEVYDTRYIIFVKQDSSIVRYDLDSLEFCGMVLFDGVQDPKIADLTNVDTELGFYYSKK
ncbi:MAG TPA: hypothetical protein VK166_02150 [Chitinophagaceae bacterium]|nr:hypothetical protein [Chitinophagaceae bacterium]